jgi:hypothetical protein
MQVKTVIHISKYELRNGVLRSDRMSESFFWVHNTSHANKITFPADNLRLQSMMRKFSEASSTRVPLFRRCSCLIVLKSSRRKITSALINNVT